MSAGSLTYGISGFGNRCQVTGYTAADGIFNGWIHEILLYDREGAMTDNDMAAIHNYFIGKWGFTPETLPVSGAAMRFHTDAARSEVTLDGNGWVATWSDIHAGTEWIPWQPYGTGGFIYEDAPNGNPGIFGDRSVNTTNDWPYNGMSASPPDTQWSLAYTHCFAVSLSPEVADLAPEERMCFLGDSSALSRAVYYRAETGFFEQGLVWTAGEDGVLTKRSSSGAVPMTPAELANVKVVVIQGTTYNVDNIMGPGRGSTVNPEYLTLLGYVHEYIQYDTHVDGVADIQEVTDYLMSRWHSGVTPLPNAVDPALPPILDGLVLCYDASEDYVTVDESGWVTGMTSVGGYGPDLVLANAVQNIAIDPLKGLVATTSNNYLHCPVNQDIIDAFNNSDITQFNATYIEAEGLFADDPNTGLGSGTDSTGWGETDDNRLNYFYDATNPSFGTILRATNGGTGREGHLFAPGNYDAMNIFAGVAAGLSGGYAGVWSNGVKYEEDVVDEDALDTRQIATMGKGRFVFSAAGGHSHRFQVVYNRMLSDAEMEMVFAWLDAKIR